MSRRRLVSTRYPYLAVRLEVHNQLVEVDALIDSGFAGSIVIPPGLFEPRRPPTAVLNWLIASGSLVRAPYYQAVLKIDPFPPMTVEVTVMGRVPLLGQAVLRQFTVILEHGRRVIMQE